MNQKQQIRKIFSLQGRGFEQSTINSGRGAMTRIGKKNENNLTRKFAFTLAEVLITLAIIGVVAAMTMQTLIQHS